jgi:hypothetical protein
MEGKSCVARKSRVGRFGEVKRGVKYFWASRRESSDHE